MGHTHGIPWTDDMIKNNLLEVKNFLKIDYMPTHSEIKEYFGNGALANKISKSGGSYVWAKKLHLPIKNSETKLGNFYEVQTRTFIEQHLGFNCELTNDRFPYDILVEHAIKIDVKASNKYNGKFSMYSFNLEKRLPTCDIFIAICIDDDKIIKTYIIPSSVLYNHSQLSIGVDKSKYDVYLDKWDIINQFVNAFKEIENRNKVIK